MLYSENLIYTLDRFNTAVYLKDFQGRYLSMNTAGINLMKDSHGSVLGKTTHELFDPLSADQMMAADYYLKNNNRVHTSTIDAKDGKTGKPLPMFNAKTPVLSSTGEPLGIVGISLVGYQDAELFSEACKFLPKFISRKYPHLLNELLELRTVANFVNLYRLH